MICYESVIIVNTSIGFRGVWTPHLYFIRPIWTHSGCSQSFITQKIFAIYIASLLAYTNFLTNIKYHPYFDKKFLSHCFYLISPKNPNPPFYLENLLSPHKGFLKKKGVYTMDPCFWLQFWLSCLQKGTSRFFHGSYNFVYRGFTFRRLVNSSSTSRSKVSKTVRIFI